MTKEWLEDYTNKLLNDDEYQALDAIFDELEIASHFGIERETDARKIGTLDAKANRLRKELLEVMDQLGQSVDRYKLIAELKEPIHTNRLQTIYTNNAEQYIQDLLDAGFSKDDINRIYLPAIKRFIKNPQI